MIRSMFCLLFQSKWEELQQNQINRYVTLLENEAHFFLSLSCESMRNSHSLIHELRTYCHSLI